MLSRCWTVLSGLTGERTPIDSMICGAKVIEFSSLVGLLRCRADRDFGFTFRADAPDSGVAEASRLSFRELDERARAIGADLVERGLTGERALLVYPPGLDYVAAFFGCLYAGVVAVPAFPPDIFRLTRTLPRLAAVATDSQAKAILTDTLILPLSSTLTGQAGLEILAASDWIATDAIPAALAGEWRQPDIRPEAAAFIQYTSGSTSTPKGVMLSHANLLENSAIIKETFGHTTESKGLSWLPIYHDMGLIGGVLQPLYSDFPITLMSPLSFLARPMSWLQAIARDGVTISGGPNFAYDLCVRKFDAQAAGGLDLSTWRVAFNGAEPVRASTLDRFAETFAPYGFRKSAFLPCYGLAEHTLIVTGKKAGEAVREESFSAAGLGRGVAEPSASPGDTMSLVGSGTACAGTRVAVVDTATGHELPDRRVGEIRVSGPSLGAGYWGQPDQSAETFVRSPRGGRWLRTGDLGFLDKGELFVTGRLKDLIIVRGRNIYPHDIEQAATDAVGELRPGCVVAFGTQRADGEELVVVAEVRREADLSAAEAITDRVRRAVTESQNVGVHEVVLVAPGTIPKTSSGKLQRSSCRQAYLDDTLEPLGRSRAEHVPEAGPDVDPVALRELSQEARHALVTDYVIGLLVSACGSAPAEISAAEPITSLGLDSLASVLVLHRIELQLDIELPVSTLLTGRSITELVDLTCAQLDESPRAVTPANQETQDPLLSEGQRSLWFMQQLDPDSSAYNLARAFAIGPADRPDDLDRDALDASLCLLLERHTSLRTTFHSNLGIPVVRIAPPARTLLRTVTIAQDALDDAMAEEAERPFDLERDPLLRAVLFVTPAAAPVLLITVHHIAVDLWSFSILLHELSVMYPALAEGRQPALPAPSSYQAYVRHQEETLRTKGASLAEYWHGKLAGELPVIELPDPRTRPEVQTYAGATWRQELSTQQTAQIKALATAAKSTPFLVLLSGLQTVLQRYTGVDDIVIGTVVAGRRQAAFASIVGYLVNTVVLRADLSGDPAFVELLGHNGIMLEEAVAHQDYPFSRVAADLSKGSDPSRSPLFQVMVAFEQSPGEPALAGLAVDEPGCTLNVGDTVWVSRPLPSRGAAFDLNLRVVETSGRLITSWEYNPDVLEEGLVARLSLDLAALLGAAADTPERRIGELPLPSETGDTVGQDLSDMTRKSGTRDPSDLAAGRAETRPTPGEPENGRVSETIRQIYADLLEIPDIGADDDFFEEGGHSLLATQLAARVRAALGVELSTRVVFTASTVRQLAAHVAGEQQASGSLPASGPRPMRASGPAPLSYSQTRLWFVDQLSPDTAAYNIPVALRLQGPLDVAALADSFDGVLRRHQALRTYFPVTETGPVQSVSDATPPRLGVVDSTETPEDEFRTELAEAARRPFDLGNGPLVRLALYRRAADDHVLLLVMHHIVADGWSLGVMTEEVTAGYEALTRGLPDPGVPPQVQYPDYARWLSEHDDDAQGEHLEYWTRQLDGSVPLNLPTRQPRPALQSFAGARYHWQLDAPTTHALRKVCRGTDGTLFMVLLAAYGLLLGRHSYASDVVIGTPISGRTHLETEGVIGFFANTLALRLDMSGDPTFTDLVLRVREVCLDGYAHQAVPFERLIEALQPARDLGRNPLFQSAFVLQNTPRPTPRLTGLEVERLELDTATSKFDISLELEESDGGLAGAFEYCTDLFDQETVSRFASDFTKLLQSIAAGPHRPLSELTAASVTPVAIAPQPAPATGLVSHGSQALTYEQLVVQADEPDGRVSETIRQIYADLLEIPDIGADDDFFEEGGHSLLATQLAARVRAALGVELSTRVVFTASTVRQLAAHVAGEQQASGSLPASGPRPMRASGPAPLSYSQTRLWFVDQLSPDTAAYNIPVALRLQGPLDVAALADSFDGVLRRHQALRTYFPVTETGPVQSVSDATPPRLGVVDSTETPEDEFRTELAEAARRPFDLGNGPLVRLALYRRAADDHVLLLVMHHIVADGWSLGVMTEEVTAGYEALTRGLPDPGVPPQVQYPDYARWLSEHDDDAQGEHLEYWTRQLDGSVPLNLPTRQPRPALQSFAGARYHWQLDAPTTHALRKVCRGTDGTLFMVLLAAYGLLLGRHSYASDVVIGTPISGRTHLETEGVIGFFANTLALRLDMSGDPTFTDLVLRVREVCLDGYAHQAVPFERLIEALQPARDLGRNPLFQSAFVLQNTPRPTPRLTGLEVERLELDTATSKFDISLELEESDGGLAGAFEYCTDLFDQETVSRFASDFTKLLQSIAAGPHRPLSELTAASVTPVAIAPQPAPATGLEELIYRQSRSTPKALAVSHGSQALTYEQLVVQAERLADELSARGLGKGDRIGLHQGRGADWVVGLVAILVSGAACVLMDPSRPEEWNQRVIREGRPHLVLHGENESDAGPSAIASEGRRPDEETVCVCFGDDALAGVGISTADLTAHVMGIRQEMAIAAGDRVLANSPQWKEAAVWECLAALTCGATFIVPAAGEESSAVLEWHAPAVVLATPDQADALGDAGGGGPRVVRIGESLPAHPTHAMRVLLTSMTAPALFWEFDAADSHWYGHQFGTAQTEIRDQFGQPVEQGVCGQLHVTGTARTTRLTAEPARTPAVHAADAGPGRQPVWHPTGVLARYATDGRVEWLGPIQGTGREEKTNVPAVAPRTPVEEVVEAVWCEVLGDGPFSVHDDFFDLGGHSLAAVQIIDRIHSIFGLKVPIQSVFQDPSIAGFTSVLTSLETSPGQTEKIAAIWKQVTGAVSDENTFLAPATDR